MACWKCSCGHYSDADFDSCYVCGRPKPGTVEQGEISHTLTFVYSNKGVVSSRSVAIKGPVNITTDESHSRLILTNIVTNGSPIEYQSFEWENRVPHGSPMQIWPLSEGGFEIICLNPGATINGCSIGAGKHQYDTGSVALLSPTMAIKMEDFRGAAVIVGSISPVGYMNDNIRKCRLYTPRGSDLRFYNGLYYMDYSMYGLSDVTVIENVEGADFSYMNKTILAMFGIKFSKFKEEIKSLEEGNYD